MCSLSKLHAAVVIIEGPNATPDVEEHVSDQNRVITNNPQCAVCDTSIEASGTSIMQFDAGEFLCFCTPSCLKAYRANPEPFRRGERISPPE